MTTNELKQYIDRVLGNSIRCLLPSYWWRRLFNLVVDKVEKVEKSTGDVAASVSLVKNNIANKADKVKYTELDMYTDHITIPLTSSGFTLDSVAVDNRELTIELEELGLVPKEDIRCVIIFRGKTKLNVPRHNWTWSSDTEPSIDFNALDGLSHYRLEVNIHFSFSRMEGTGVFTISTLCAATLKKLDESRFSYDETITSTSVGAPQTKAIKAYVDNAIAQSITNTLNTAV